MNILNYIKLGLNFVLVFLIGVFAILFSILYLSTFVGGFLFVNKRAIIIIITACVCIISISALIFSLTNNKFIYKLSILVLGLFSIIVLSLYLLKIFGILDKINSIQALRNYVASFGYMAIIIYIIINFLQVVILPIPGFISVATGVALFGAFYSSIFSLIGIVIGSIVAFYIGRILGYKVVSWLIGKETLDKWLNNIKNKDKIILTFMFLFPFFPDDVLCFVAGLSSMSSSYFIIMIIICRIISVFTTAYSLNGSIIPYNSWWGIVIWVIFIVLTILATIFIYKKGDKIQKFLKKFRRKKGVKNNSSR